MISLKRLQKLSKNDIRDLYEAKIYKNFRIGISFRSVRIDLSYEQKIKRKNGEYMFVTRKTVLGRMKQLKETVFEMYDFSANKEDMIKYLLHPKKINIKLKVSEIESSF